jgi:hypothetical protein
MQHWCHLGLFYKGGISFWNTGLDLNFWRIIFSSQSPASYLNRDHKFPAQQSNEHYWVEANNPAAEHS